MKSLLCATRGWGNSRSWPTLVLVHTPSPEQHYLIGSAKNSRARGSLCCNICDLGSTPLYTRRARVFRSFEARRTDADNIARNELNSLSLLGTFSFGASCLSGISQLGHGAGHEPPDLAMTDNTLLVKMDCLAPRFIPFVFYVRCGNGAIK